MPVIMFANVLIGSFSSLLVPEFSRLLAGENYNRLKTVCDTILKLHLFFLLVLQVFLLYSLMKLV